MLYPEQKNIVKQFGKMPETLDELAESVISVINSQTNGCYGRSSGKFKVLGLVWDINYSARVSNSHSRPLNGVSNFMRNEDLATAYPGFTGRVWIRYSEECVGFGSDPFRATLTHTGTGGGGSYGGIWETVSGARFRRYGHSHRKNQYPPIACHSWDYRFFLSDFPAIERIISEAETLAILKNEIFTMNHRFSWEDPETLAKDDAFIEECLALAAAEDRKINS
jgi:hypothetical protein